MRGMRSRKRKVGSHFVRMFGTGKEKDNGHRQGLDAYGPNKGGENGTALDKRAEC